MQHTFVHIRVRLDRYRGRDLKKSEYPFNLHLSRSQSPMTCITGNSMPRASLSKRDLEGVGPTFHTYSVTGFAARRGRSSGPPSNYFRNEL